jgi:hypothetical protein
VGIWLGDKFRTPFLRKGMGFLFPLKKENQHSINKEQRQGQGLYFW